MLPLVMLLPPIVAIAGIAVLREQQYARYIALAASLASLGLLFLVGYGEYQMQWFQVGPYALDITTLVTPVNMLLLTVIALITPLIVFYSFGFMDVESEQRRFYIEILAFTTAMLGFAMSGNFIMLFVCWEFLSLTSYLLIGFWHLRERAVKAARKALTVIFIGDIALLIAIVMFFSVFGTLDFSVIVANLGNTALSGSLYFAVIMLLIAIFTKSAQFPFQEWLIDAMEGPTPVSAFLHSTTMVKAGVFVTIMLLPLLSFAGVTQFVLIFAVLTAVIATLNALKERHIKKVIAYSTIQELSLMLIAVSSSALIAGVYFFFAQSFYKALLFFSAGSVMKATDKEDLHEVSGLGSDKLAVISTLFGVLSLAGFIPFDGFFANVGLGSSISNLYVYAIISAISLITSMYIFRWFFYASTEARDGGVRLGYERLPRSMALCMAILAASTLAASIFFTQISGFLKYSGYYDYASYGTPLPGLGSALASQGTLVFLAIIAAGAAISYMIYVRNVLKEKKDSFLSFVHTGRLFAFFYAIAARAACLLADGAGAFDERVSEMFDTFGRMTMASGLGIRRISVGNINLYMFIVMAGILVLLAYLYLLVG
ncbi:MAG: NADH-quinone oxidoreductase subunit L [Candidatus Micrarchaeota archaeon]|nr:NADH-quinone oxidoreductase subunit L [Candidatus Micrarchaeota archaeon]